MHEHHYHEHHHYYHLPAPVEAYEPDFSSARNTIKGLLCLEALNYIYTSTYNSNYYYKDYSGE